MKVSLITTVKNEEETIESFLESIFHQTRKPDEVIIVDGGSTDDTVSKIKSSKLKIKNLKVIRKKGNRSVGRNTGIKESLGPIIAVTDAGCILDSHWLERLTKPFEEDFADIVGGFYKPKTNGVFEKCLATYTSTMQNKLDKKNFLPSSRSVAFKKSSWEKVNGYPEHLNTCEDLVFDKKLKKAGFKFKTEDKAFVWWPQRKNILEAVKQFYSYAKGDGEAHFFRPTTPFLYIRYFLGICFLAYIIFSQNYSLLIILASIFLLYLLWSIFKNYKYVKRWQAFFYLPLLQITSDIAVLVGTTIGFLKTV